MSSHGTGVVLRRGGDLQISVPAGPALPFRALHQELVIFAGARTGEDGDLLVPVVNAAQAAEVLARAWPSGLWKWDWLPDALDALARAQQMQDTVRRALDEPDHADAAALHADLRAAGFTRTLLPAQVEAVARLRKIGGGGNFSVPGSGKTTMTYALFALLRAAGVVDRMLVISPISAYEAWSAEAADCFDEAHRPHVALAPAQVGRNSDVLVMNYERAASGATRAAIDTWAHGHRFLVAFDEAHRAKRGVEGSHGRGAVDLSSLATARLVLTGTPMPNGPSDLAAILDLAYPGYGLPLADPSTVHADRSWVRVTKDKLELEPAEVITDRVTLDPAHRRIYDALVSEAVTAAEVDPRLGNRAIMRILAAASNPALLLDDDGELGWPHEVPVQPDLATLLGDVAGSVRPAKLLSAAAHAEAHVKDGRKLLIWTSFLGNVKELARLLAPFEPAVITGQTPREDPTSPTDRERELARFRADPSCGVLIATPQTLGEGVSLHRACQSQLHVDRTFNAGIHLQALDRTHRVGMPDGTRAKVRILVARGTMDEQVDRALRAKMRRMDAVLGDPTLARLARVETSDSYAPDEATTRRLLAHLRTQA